MVVMYVIPCEVEGMVAYAVGILSALIAMCLIDRRNIEQKLFLAVVLYLLEWISQGIGIIPRNIVLNSVAVSELWASRPMVLFACYTVVEALYVVLRFAIMALFIYIIDKVYVSKKENMEKKNWG